MFCRNAFAQAEIVQQRGKLFSVFAPGGCQRSAQNNLQLVLNCEFLGQRLQLYLKEGLSARFSGYTGSGTQDWNPVVNSALSEVANNLNTPEIVDRINFSAGSGPFGTRDRMVVNKSGFLYKTTDDAAHFRWGKFEKRVFLRLIYIPGRASAVVVAFSDFRIVSQENRQTAESPEEAKAIVASMGLADERVVP